MAPLKDICQKRNKKFISEMEFITFMFYWLVSCMKNIFFLSTPKIVLALFNYTTSHVCCLTDSLKPGEEKDMALAHGGVAKLIEFHLFLVYHLKFLTLFWNFFLILQPQSTLSLVSFMPCSFVLPYILIFFSCVKN